MDYEEVGRHVGHSVLFTSSPGMPARPGVIRSVRQLVHVEFTDHDGGVLAVNPFCLRLYGESPTLFGNTHEGL